jgi:hypothetical protein
MVLQPSLDKEFKMFLKFRGVEVTSSLFDLQFTEPQSFSQYRDIELDSAKTALFSNIEGVQYLSRRFILSKYLGLTEDEIIENERMWKEENQKDTPAEQDSISNLNTLGVRNTDINNFEPTDVDAENDDTEVGVEPAAGEPAVAEPGAGVENEI